jgi:hypothetical protein
MQEIPCRQGDIYALADALVPCHISHDGELLNWDGGEPEVVQVASYYCANCGDNFGDDFKVALAHLPTHTGKGQA